MAKYKDVHGTEYKVMFYDFECRKATGGKRPLWHATLRPELKRTEEKGYQAVELPYEVKSIVGAGNNADNAIKDWYKMYRAFLKNKS